MMWLMAISASSTTTVKWYSGVPSERTMIRSPPRAVVSIETWPRMMSSKSTTPSPTRKRTTDSRPAASFARLCPADRDLPALAIAVVRLALAQQPLRRGRVMLEALHLPVRPVGAACWQPCDLWPLVPLHAQPVQLLENVLLEGEGRARHGRVFGAPE